MTEKMITADEVAQAQKVWGQGIVAIGKEFTDKGDYVKAAENHIDTLYAFQAGAVLFKPTKAADAQFRMDRESAFHILSAAITSMVKTMVLPFTLGPTSVLRMQPPRCMVTMPWPWVIIFLPRQMVRKSRLSIPLAISKGTMAA